MSWDFPLFPQDLTNHERLTSEPGAFGYKRSYYWHQGVDLYVQGEAPVLAAEPGVVVSIVDFTGGPDEPHWLETQAVMVAGPSGLLCYGEVRPKQFLNVGTPLFKGQKFANVVPVLPKGDQRPDIPGHSRYMLHFEWYKNVSRRDPCSWLHGDPRPSDLLDPTDKLQAAWEKMLRK